MFEKHFAMEGREAVEAAVDEAGSERGEVRVGTEHLRRRRRSRFLRGRLPFTTGAKEALVRSLRICSDEGHRTITTTHLLAALALGGGRDPAVRLIRSLGVEPAELDAALREGWRRAS